MKKRSLAAALIILAAPLVAFGNISKPGDAVASVGLFDEPLSQEKVRGSLNYLMGRYGVSESEALRRLELQRISPMRTIETSWLAENGCQVARQPLFGTSGHPLP